MWLRSTSDWLSKNSLACEKWSANFSGLPRTLSSTTGSGNDTTGESWSDVATAGAAGHGQPSRR